MTASPTRIIALPWYSREDYARLRSIIVDSYGLAPTYAQWLMVAERNEAVAHRSGIPVKRVIIEPDTFARWCENQGVAAGWPRANVIRATHSPKPAALIMKRRVHPNPHRPSSYAVPYWRLWE